MSISHKYKFLLIEAPSTGYTAISKELQENYSSQPTNMLPTPDLLSVNEKES